MGTILLILFLGALFFIIWPVIKVAWAVNRARTQARDFFREARGNGSKTRPNPATAPQKRKKIDPNVGEYVEFEEITTHSSTTVQDQTITYETEQQIIDAEWEEIK